MTQTASLQERHRNWLLRPWWRVWWHFEQHRHRDDGVSLSGYHNRNYVIALRDPLATIVRAEAGDFAKIREPLRTVRVVPRVWRNEAAVLRTVQPYVPNVPSCLFSLGRKALHTYATGVTLSELHPRGEPVGEETLRRIATIFRQIAAVPHQSLPKLPASWPADGDSTGFLRRLVTFAERRVQQRNRRAFAVLFDQLRIPLNLFDRFHAEAKSLQPRPFRLLHTDLHRDNLVVLPNNELFVLDWETALIGDPLHDLATHLGRMDYAPEEHDRLIDLWYAEMQRSGNLEGLQDFRTDLRLYLDFEYAQSVYPDTLRAALSLGKDPEEVVLDAAVTATSRALKRAERPLGLLSLPSYSEVRAALLTWHSGHRRSSLGWPSPSYSSHSAPEARRRTSTRGG